LHGGKSAGLGFAQSGEGISRLSRLRDDQGLRLCKVCVDPVGIFTAYSNVDGDAGESSSMIHQPGPRDGWSTAAITAARVCKGIDDWLKRSAVELHLEHTGRWLRQVPAAARNLAHMA